jgi:carboxyl-terminal processing protease
LPRSTPSRLLASLVLLLGIALCAGSVRGNDARQRLDQFKKKAIEAENRGAWLEACRLYDELVRKSPDASAREGFRESYQRCLRRLQLYTRHSDRSYRETVGKLSLTKALNTYEQVVQILNCAYHDRARADLDKLFAAGLKEVALALEDSVFKQHFLADVKPAAIATFKNRLESWPARRFASAKEAKEQVRLLIGQAARDGLPTGGPLGGALVMEFAAGACNALDEYSSFITPTHLTRMQSPRLRLGGGIGVSLSGDNEGAITVTHVWPAGPATDKLMPGDRIVRVNKKSVEGLTVDEVTEKLQRGKVGSSVEVEYERDKVKDTAQMKFRDVRLPGVESRLLTPAMDAHPIGYLRINYFTEDSYREVKEALDALTSQGSLRGLVLDLRGNPGGVFTAAVQVAELFLATGVISVGQSTHPNFNRTFKVESPGAMHQLPLVVLVDSDTASAAEVLAAALKETRDTAPTTLMGQTTYGKGSIQCLIELKPSAKTLDKTAAIRLTVAKLFSPSNVPISGKGIKPDDVLDAKAKPVEVAQAHLRGLLKSADAMLTRNMMRGDGMQPSGGPPQ